MTGTDLCVNKSQFVPVIFEPLVVRELRFCLAESTFYCGGVA